jgi:hypothetical protein
MVPARGIPAQDLWSVPVVQRADSARGRGQEPTSTPLSRCSETYAEQERNTLEVHALGFVGFVWFHRRVPSWSRLASSRESPRVVPRVLERTSA